MGMKKITLVCTVHQPNGRCNATELLSILREISPDALFEEIRASDFAARYGNPGLHTLEMRAILSYLQQRTARQFPVDAYTIPDRFRDDQCRLDDHVFCHSEACGAQYDEIQELTARLGFPYLNSPGFLAQFSRFEQLFEAAVLDQANEDMCALLASWNQQVRQRDTAMLDNIYKVCREEPFSNGVFLVGAAHMTGIVEGIRRRTGAEADLVEWTQWKGP